MQELQYDVVLLQKIVYRNRNQHRLSVWWRHVRMLLRRLKQSLDGNEKAKIAILEQLPKSYFYFTNLIAHGQYPALGLVLLGILARVWFVMGGIEYEAKIQSEIVSSQKEQKKLELQSQDDIDTGTVVARDELLATEPISLSINPASTSHEKLTVSSPNSFLKNQDESLFLSSSPITVSQGTKRKSKNSNSTVKKKKKRARKGRDEIDDIFG